MPHPAPVPIENVNSKPSYEELLSQVQHLTRRLSQAGQKELEAKAAMVQWQDTFDAMADAVSVFDTDRRIIRCNKAMLELLGRKEADILGRRCWELVHGSDRPLSNCPCLSVNRSLQRDSMVMEERGRWYQVTVDPRLDEQRRLKGYIHTMSDITQAVQKEAALRETHHTLLTILDSMEAMIYATDLAGYEVIFMNRYMRELFQGDLTGQTCWRAFYKRQGPCDQCRSDELLNGEGLPKGIRVWEDIHPTLGHWFLHQDRAVKWVDGRKVRLHVGTDISQIKAMEQERLNTEGKLRQAQKMEAIGTLAGGIAHDFNNILSAILGYSELALDDAQRGKASPNYIAQILRAGYRARDLVRQILTFSRQTETEAKHIQVKPIIKEALKLLRASLPSTIEIRTEIESDAVVKADPIQIHQVIMNLCTNAGHAMRRSGGRLNVLLAEESLEADFTNHFNGMQPDRYLKIEVGDTGHGIAPSMIERIFDPYFTTKEKGEGTGMGLAVVQGIVRSCGGAVTVASTPGKGSLFKVYLPIIQTTDLAHAPAQQMVPLGSERILMVDDEAPLVAICKEMLERLGYTVTASTISTEALALFQKNPRQFDLVITDMTMPYMTGDVLAQRLLAIRPDLPIVICTGYSQNLTQEMIERLGIRALLMKPIIRNELGLTLRKVLDAHKVQQRN